MRNRDFDVLVHRGLLCVRDPETGRLYPIPSGGAGATIDNYQAVLKTVYARDMVDLLPRDFKLIKSMEKREKEMWQGRDPMPVPIKTGRNQSFTMTRPGGPIGEAQNQEQQQLGIGLRWGRGRVQFISELLKVAKTNKAAFVRVMENEMDGLRKDTNQSLNRQGWGDGRGILCLANGAASTTAELVVDAPMGVAGATNGARFLQRNQKIAILDSTGTTLLATRRVTQIGFGTTNDGARVTVNAALSATLCPDNAIITLCPNLTVQEVSDTSFNQEAMGMLGMLDDGTFVNTYFGLSRTTFNVLQANVVGSIGALSIDVLQQILDVTEQLGEGSVAEHWMHHSVRRAYLALLIAQRQYLSQGGANSHDGGWKGNALDKPVEFGGKPVYVDKDAPYGFWYMLDPDGLVYYPNTEGEWADDGVGVLRPLDDVDGYEAIWRWGGNFAHEASNRCGVGSGISANIAIIHPQ